MSNLKVRRRRACPLLAAVAAGCLATAATAYADPTVTTLATFTGPNGSDPQAPLAIDAAGNLYGTTVFGGGSGEGTAFELSGTAHQTLTTLATFNTGSGRGQYPYAGLVVDSSGNLYGSTFSGAPGGGGIVYRLSGSNHQTYGEVAALIDGGPVVGLTLDGAGNLYGTTGFGGTYGDGSVFELVGGGPRPVTLVSFNGSNGTFPNTRLVVDPSGNLYGATANGGSHDAGVVFELSGTNHTTLTQLASFAGTPGAYLRYPGDGLAFDAAGNLYGAAESAFELSGPTHQTLSVPSTFDGGTVGFPYGLINVGTAGDLYGATTAGTVVRLSGATHGTLTVMAQLTLPDGSYPSAGLVADAAGTLYGVTSLPPTTSGGDDVNGDVYAVAGVTGSAYGLTRPALTQGVQFEASYAGTGIYVQAYAGLTVVAGQKALVDPADAAADRQLIVLTGTGLSLAGSAGKWTGTIDLTDNDLVLTVGSLATVTDQLRQGYAGGTWNGSGGITSSSAAANPARDTALGVVQNDQGGTPLYSAANLFDGVAPDPSDLLVRYTFYGDANLDGKVDGRDYALIDTGYASKGKLTGWYNGDFNYDGKVDASDYTLIDDAFNLQTATSSPAAVPTAEVAAETTAVPEPPLAAAASFGGLALLARRRRP